VANCLRAICLRAITRVGFACQISIVIFRELERGKLFGQFDVIGAARGTGPSGWLRGLKKQRCRY